MQTLELLAEVAVLEEEVVRLEEQVVNFRQGLYQEAVHTTPRKNAENSIDLCEELSARSSKQEESQCLSQNDANSGLYGTQTCRLLSRSVSSRKLFSSKPVFDKISHCSNRTMHSEQALEKPNTSLEDGRGKENRSCPNSAKDKNDKQPPEQRTCSFKTSAKRTPINTTGKCADSPKLQVYTIWQF